MTRKRGVVYTFYSYKGGVGRSMTLANIAALLAKMGNDVLIIDWDLEAPGLDKYFSKYSTSESRSRKNTPGIVDIVNSFSSESKISWTSCIIEFDIFPNGKPISILTAGQESDDYVKNLQMINWDTLFESQNFGLYLEQMREDWISKYDFVLVDSRTGITDIGGICTIHLPDILILLFTANEQSVNGIVDVMKRAKQKTASLPFDRTKLLGVPVPSRFENNTEYKLAIEWKQIFAQQFADIYNDWLPDRTSPSDVLEKLFIPYVPYWSFGEGLPVLDEGTSDPRGIGFSYDLLARLMTNQLRWNETLKGELSLSNERASERVNQDAEIFFSQLNDTEQEIAKNIFLRLVRVAQATDIEDTPKKTYEKAFAFHELEVVSKLVEARLLYKTYDGLTKEPTYEISKNNLFQDWLRFRTWIEENREFLAWRQDLENRAYSWNLDKEDVSLLLSGTFLNQAKKLLDLRREDFNREEFEYIKTSIEQDFKVKRDMARIGLINSYKTVAPYIIIIFIAVSAALLGFQYLKQNEQNLARYEMQNQVYQLQLKRMEQQNKELQTRQDSITKVFMQATKIMK